MSAALVADGKPAAAVAAGTPLLSFHKRFDRFPAREFLESVDAHLPAARGCRFVYFDWHNI